MMAPKLALDFKRDSSFRKSIGAWLLLGGVCAGIAAAMTFVVENKELLQVKQQTAELRKAPAASPAEQENTMDRTQLAEEIKRANDIMRQLNLPWNGLFLAMESAASDRVALLSIQPDVRKRTIRISGEAKNLEAMLDYLARLRGQEILSQVVLSSHEIKEQDPDKPVRFSLSAKWATAR
ncbi:MAG: PilN domain-containing protein [Gammaproteobacteria bacterium]|nr:PilN domain-containing protein [Gammaproteobacteria bacterium]